MKMTMTAMMTMTTTSILCLLALTVVVLQRLVSLESTVAELTRTVQQQQMQIGQLTNHVQESTSRSLQVMEDQACLLTFFNETGTPTCKVNYHLSADYGLAVVGDSSFEGESTMNVSSKVILNNYTVFKRRTKFEYPASFTDTAIFTDKAFFYEDVAFRGGSDVTFRASATFYNETTFYAPVEFTGYAEFHEDVDFHSGSDVGFAGYTTFDKKAKFQKEAEFKGYVDFYKTVEFGYDADVEFWDTVTFRDDTLVQSVDGETISFAIDGDVEIGFSSSFDRISFGGSILSDVGGIEGDEAGLCNVCPPLAPDFFANQVVTVGGLTVLGSSDFESVTVDGNLTVTNSTFYGGFLNVSTKATVDGKVVATVP